MTANYFEQEALTMFASEIAARELVVKPDSSDTFVELANKFPTHHSRIDWQKIPAAAGRLEERHDHQVAAFLDFFSDCIAKFQLHGDMLYVGDGPTDFVLLFSVAKFRQFARELLTIPSHHYFIASDFTWCACCTMAGDMDFGYRP